MDENWKELFTALGRLENSQDNLTDHVKAVSNKVDLRFKEAMDETREVRKALETHSLNDNAHGQGGERRGRGMVSGAIMGVIGALGAVFAIFKTIAALGVH